MVVRLRALLEQRHWRNHRTFCIEYEKAAISVDPRLRGTAPSRAQLHRWLSGELRHLPYGDHCRVLEQMFPQWSARQLFEPASAEDFSRSSSGARNLLIKNGAVGGNSTTTEPAENPISLTDSSSDPERQDLLRSIPHSFSATVLGGYWVTGYEYDSVCHADISMVTPRSDRHLTIRNYPPNPRVEGRISSFRNEVTAELANRHLVGFWKNINDAYYFGSIHLAVLPGETVMEGHYTCFLSDVQVVTAPWKWVRIDSASLHEVELSRTTLRDPRLICSLLAEHSQHDVPLTLADVAEDM